MNLLLLLVSASTAAVVFGEVSFDPLGTGSEASNSGMSVGRFDDRVQDAVNDPLAVFKRQTCLDMIDLVDAWEVMRLNNPVEVPVAIIDSGIMVDHPDLKKRLWSLPGHPEVHGYNVVKGNSDITDSNRHGTQLAGIVGAERNNWKGITGVNPYARLMGVNIYGDLSGVSVPMAAGIKYAAEHGARVALLATSSTSVYDDSDVLKQMMEYAAEKYGMFMVTAAGNRGQDVEDPLRYPCVFASVHTICVTASVSAERKLMRRAGFGMSVDIAAPGARVLSTTIFKIGSAQYTTSSGTTQAAAIVAGVVSMLLSVGVSDRAIKDIILGSTDKLEDVGKPIGINESGGFLNASRAMRQAMAGGVIGGP